MVSGSTNHCQAPTAVQMEMRTKRTKGPTDTKKIISNIDGIDGKASYLHKFKFNFIQIIIIIISKYCLIIYLISYGHTSPSDC